MTKQLIAGCEVEFKPLGLEEDPGALLTACVNLLGLNYSAVAIAILWHDRLTGIMEDFHNPYGEYVQVAADQRWQEELEHLCPAVKEGRWMQTVHIDEREYVVFFTPHFE